MQHAAAGLAAVSTWSFTAIVLDLVLPDGDGLSVLRWLRQNGRVNEIELASPMADGLVVGVTLPFTSAHTQVRPAA